MTGIARWAAVVAAPVLCAALAACGDTSFEQDAAVMCSRITATNYDSTTVPDIVSAATPGDDGRAQIERALRMAEARCPQHVGVLVRTRARIYGY